MSEDKKEKKPIWKRWWLWAIVILVLLIAACSNGGNKATNNGGSSSTNSEATTYGLNQEAPAGDLSFTVNSITKKTTVGSGMFAKTSQSGTYVIVNVTIKNSGKDTVTVDSSLFLVTDNQDREFKYSTDGQTALMATGNENFFLKQINPGLSVTGDVVFELPQDAAGLKFVGKAGVFSSKKATINLE
ncbi:MAG: hypothetical protein A2X20_06180 [Bacteroidetes bacterium GWE2_40_15]|nr:MAG: hypothetical protein A2X20_06180 [Bacteroidetes bacterium GWE2_40_15]